MEDFCKDHDAVLISPVSVNAERIIQVGQSGDLELVSTEEMRGLKTRAMNACTFCNMERKGVECCHHSLDVLVTNPRFHDDPNTEKTRVSTLLYS